MTKQILLGLAIGAFSLICTAAPMKWDDEAALDQLQESAETLMVYRGAVKIETLSKSLVKNLGVLANKKDVAVTHHCTELDNMGIVECTLAMQYGDLAGGTTPARAVIYSYSAQIIKMSDGAKQVNIKPAIQMEITN